MEIIFVPSGGYKSFYINCFLKLKKCDLLVFNFAVLYDFDKENFEQNALILNELSYLSNHLKCAVVAGVYKLENGEKTPIILVCEGRHFTLTPASVGARVIVEGKEFFVGCEASKICGFNKIILSKRRIYPRAQACDKRKIYLFCDDFGVTIVKNKKIQRKFTKFPKIILN